MGRDLAISLVLTVALVLGAEFAVRWLGIEIPFILVPNERNCLQRSALLGMEYASHCSGVSGVEGTRFRTNALGLRDTEIMDDGRIRILSAGDSCTWGWSVIQTDAYPQVLQRALERKLGAKKFRVINDGRPGFTSYQGVLDLSQRSLALRPEIVIFGYGFNDTVPRGDIEEELQRQRLALPLTKFDDTLIGVSRLWRLLRAVAPARSQENLPQRSTPEKYKRNLTEIVRLIREHGAKPLMINFWGHGLRHPHLQVVEEVERELNVPTVYYDGPRLDVIHPTRAGYRQLVNAIMARMEKEGYLETAGRAETQAASAPGAPRLQ